MEEAQQRDQRKEEFRSIEDDANRMLAKPFKSNPYHDWQLRLAFPFSTIKNLIECTRGLESLSGVAIPKEIDCNRVAANIRMHNKPQPVVNRPQSDVFSQLFFDIKGPVTPPSLQGFQLVVCIVDFRSHFGFVYPMRNKSEMPEVFKRFWADTALIRKKFPIHCVKATTLVRTKIGRAHV